MLNDGLDPDRSPSPKRKHCQSVRPKASGLSVTHASAHAHSMTKKHGDKHVTPAIEDKETELVDLEKIMDSFDAEEEKIIGTIVKVDDEGLHDISNSLPWIMLNEENVTNQQDLNSGMNSLTANLEGVTSHCSSTNTPTSPICDNTASTKVDKMEGVTPTKVKIPKAHSVSPENSGSNGVTSKIAAAQYTDRVMLVQRETTQLYPVTPEDATSKSVGQATAGVTNDPKKDELTPVNDLLKVVTSSRTSFYVSIPIDAALHNIITASTVTPANNKQKENENCLLDLVNKTNE